MTRKKTGNPVVLQPWVYELIYPDMGQEMAAACQQMIEKFMPGDTLNILDVGCGTGRTLQGLADSGHSVVGIDSSEPMVDYATVTHPELSIQLGDMKDFDLGRVFDFVMCGGSTFTCNLNNADVHKSLANFRKHCRDGGLLALGMLNASRFLGSETFNESVEIRVDEGDFHARAFSRHLLDRRRQSFRRVRTWKIDGQEEPVVDDAQFRLFFPLEIEDYLSHHRFSVLGIWDNKDLQESDLFGRRIFIAARAI
jgi:SAM-dependent methyltransferase